MYDGSKIPEHVHGLNTFVNSKITCFWLSVLNIKILEQVELLNLISSVIK